MKRKEKKRVKVAFNMFKKCKYSKNYGVNESDVTGGYRDRDGL